MSLADALWLALVQALTEFLPVSSSGHLRLFREFFIPAMRVDLRFDLFLHIGTLLAVLIYYYRRIAVLGRSLILGLPRLREPDFWQSDDAEGLRYLALLVLATIPTVILGFSFRDLVSSDAISTFAIGALLIVNAGILLVGHFRSRANEDARIEASAAMPAGEGDASIRTLGVWRALVIGTAQGLAVFPGLSRSGTTISAALMVGESRERAVEFSFFLSIFSISGAVVLEVLGAPLEPSVVPVSGWVLGFVITLVAGLAALAALRFVVKRGGLQYFALYCVLVGSVTMWLTRGGAG